EINRMTASKYLAILEATRQIAVREVGKAKLHYPKSNKNQKWLKLNNYKSSCGLNNLGFIFVLFLFFTATLLFVTTTTANYNGDAQKFEISVIKDYPEKLIILEIQGPPLTNFSLILINPENKSISPKDNVSFQTDQEGRYELHLIGFVPGKYLVKLRSNDTEYTKYFGIEPFVESECNRTFLEYRAENVTKITEFNESVAGDYVWDICRDFVESNVTKDELISEITENRSFFESENVTNETIDRPFVEEELNITEITENRTFLENETVVNETVINETERSFVEQELNVTEITENRFFVENELNVTNMTNITETRKPAFKSLMVAEMSVLTKKRNFEMNEKPKFRFTSKKKFLDERGGEIEEDAGLENLTSFVYGPDKKPVDIETKILRLGSGEYKIELSRERVFRPGLYRVRIVLEEKYEREIEFLWGVLAINTHKSIYLENEEAFIGIAVLDNEGHMVCDADVTLKITDPQNVTTKLTTSDGTIKISNECEFYGVTNLPDYYTHYTVNTEGTYEMNLTAVTRNGVRTMTDTFLV
ncbi:MAG: hypothetical protein KAW40_04090, partial [Candidatus Aenigmarchaeota archaeon]|nr:hypothetical protein [Candidatus Aenigmarchaeota archaeon]